MIYENGDWFIELFENKPSLIKFSWRNFTLHFGVLKKEHHIFGYEEDWYDGPIPTYGCGPLFLFNYLYSVMEASIANSTRATRDKAISLAYRFAEKSFNEPAKSSTDLCLAIEQAFEDGKPFLIKETLVFLSYDHMRIDNDALMAFLYNIKESCQHNPTIKKAFDKLFEKAIADSKKE